MTEKSVFFLNLFFAKENIFEKDFFFKIKMQTGRRIAQHRYFSLVLVLPFYTFENFTYLNVAAVFGRFSVFQFIFY